MGAATKGITVLLVLVAACGGKLAIPSDDAGTVVPDGAGSCSDGVALPASRACVPGLAQSNVPLSIDIDSTFGCLPCGATLDPCSVAVTGNTITVGMSAQLCPVEPRRCPRICLVAATTCRLPPLPAGSYTVNVIGEGDNGLSRQLVVSDDATATRCELVQPPPSVGPFDFSSYDRACTTADDCTIVPSLLCRPCACEDTGIAKTAVDAYTTDFRAATSQCPPQPAGACAPCLPRTVACRAGRCMAD